MNEFALLYDYCMSRKGAEETFPFDDVTLVFKVKGKMFAILPTDSTSTVIALKCDPERAIELREQYEAITAGYHLNKKHWNSVEVDGRLSLKLVYELIDHSYDLVVKSLKKAQQAALQAL